MKCVHCPGDIHYGPYAMALRNADDPVLDDETALSAAWYHTSTDPHWPPHGRRDAGGGRIITRITPDDAADSCPRAP